jgi:retron-type reverse transcriptase
LIEAPKADMKRIQRKILRDILDLVPPHDCAHGFTKGRSCISYAQLHAGERIVVAIDLKDYFLSVPLAKVHGLFRCLGYPWAVARLLTGLCSTATPRSVFEQLPNTNAHGWKIRSLYQSPHLPQGAPTSPALANLCSWRMDCRLAGLARHMNARYTRYADDLAFSGDDDLAEQTGALIGCVRSIVKEEGFVPNSRKTRIMRQGQRQFLTGLIINQHINVPRAQCDALKAILHNCARFGPDGQNRGQHPEFRSHLNGRITWIENVNPYRGHKLRALFDKIDWS